MTSRIRLMAVCNHQGGRRRLTSVGLGSNLEVIADESPQQAVQPTAQRTGTAPASVGASPSTGKTVTSRAVVKHAACTAAGLVGRTGDYEDGIQFVHWVLLTNTGKRTCTLNGGPSRVVGIEGDGSRRLLAKGVPSADLVGQWGNTTGPPATIAPEHHAQFALFTTALCPLRGGIAYTALAVAIGANDSVRVPLPDGLRWGLLCGGPLGASGFGTVIKDKKG